MIVPMKKAYLIVQAHDAKSALLKVRRLGLLHVQHSQLPQSKDTVLLQEEAALLAAAQDLLASQDARHSVQQPLPGDWRVAARHIVDCAKRIEQLESYGRALAAQAAQWEKWGDFDPQDVAVLRAQGVGIGLYQIPMKQRAQVPDDCVAHTAYTEAGVAYVALARKGALALPFKEIPLPKQSLAQMRAKIAHDGQLLKQLKGELAQAVHFREALGRVSAERVRQLDLARALAGMGHEQTLTYIEGYVPNDAVARFESEARENRWGLFVRDPRDDEEPPTLLRNPRWVQLISPVFKLLEVSPGYRELDVSPVFLIFFSVFFGMLIGDAGYGLVYGVLSFAAHRIMARRGKNASGIYLLYVLSACAVIWGALTGTFFGQEWVLAAGYRPLAPQLNDPVGIQTFCFFLGALHLSLAHGWRAVLKSPSLEALADVGWICILWASFFLARVLILSQAAPSFLNVLIIAGITLVLFFTSPQKNILKTIGAGLGTIALSLMNNFTDVVSYIRLFAVGLAGVKIADAFNLMASGAASGTVAGFVVAGVALIVGHTLGIVLGPVSVLVHGVRLNVLEFSGHANVSWSGVPYKPLAEE